MILEHTVHRTRCPASLNKHDLTRKDTVVLFATKHFFGRPMSNDMSYLTQIRNLSPVTYVRRDSLDHVTLKNTSSYTQDRGSISVMFVQWLSADVRIFSNIKKRTEPISISLVMSVRSPLHDSLTSESTCEFIRERNHLSVKFAVKHLLYAAV